MSEFNKDRYIDAPNTSKLDDLKLAEPQLELDDSELTRNIVVALLNLGLQDKSILSIVRRSLELRESIRGTTELFRACRLNELPVAELQRALKYGFLVAALRESRE